MKLVYLLMLLLLGSWATARAEGCMGETCTFPIKPEVGNAISPLSCGAQPCLDPGDGGGGGGGSWGSSCRQVCYYACGLGSVVMCVAMGCGNVATCTACSTLIGFGCTLLVCDYVCP